MPFPYQRILCPIDFDDNSLAALDTAAYFARRADCTVYDGVTRLGMITVTDMLKH